MTVDDVQSNATAAVFGTVWEQDPARTFAFYVRQGGDDSTVVAYGDTARGGLFPRGKKVSLSVGPDGAMWTWDGGSERLSLTPGFARNGVTPLMIGDANAARREDDIFPAGTGAAMKLHRFRIWRGGLELLHDYVPCIDPTGRYGVYDTVKGTFLPCGREIGFTVNGRDVGFLWQGADWAYFHGVLSLTNATTYVLSGLATNNEMRVRATDAAKVVLSNMVVFASERPAIGVAQTNLTVAAGQMLKTGDTPETLRYAKAYDGERCVRAAPCVTVAVKDIPHVMGFTVSNAVEVITNAARAATCRVMAGDDVYVGYTLGKDCFSKSPNPLAYPAITSDITVDAGTIEILPYLPYRAWNGTQTVDCVCSNYTVVATNTQTFADGQWYAVTGTVSCGTITVSGSAHLILCDGAALTANGGDREPGVEVRGENSLHIYGQIGGTGALAANGGRGGSGIGGGDGGGPAGTVTIDGGTVTATGGYYGAGIGGGNQNAGGTVTINGGTVTARGGDSAAGVGGGRDGAGGAVAINGGTVTADRGDRGVDIGGGWFGTGASVTIDGGSVKAMKIKNAPRNVVWDPLYRVAVKCPGLEGMVSLEGLEGYGTNDIHAVEGRVYLWVPSGTHRFTVSGGKAKYHYYAVVREWGVTVEPIPPVGFFVNGKDIGTTVSGDEDKWMYDRSAGKLHLAGFGPYVLSGLATDNEVEVDVEWNGARVVLSNAVVITEWRPALRVAQPAALLMAGGASYLAANGSEAVSVADGPGLVVDLARGADREESEIEVFNSGDEVAIAGKGAVRADGGTFSVWADRQAVETPNAFTCGADEVMMTGWTPEEMRYATACGTEPCIVVGPAVTVTVKDIPHVTGFTVSNAVETITNAARAATCRVMLRDDVYVGYTLEKDFFSLSPNPLAYPTVTSNVVVDADAISIQRAFPYRTWNGTRTVDCVCSNYTVVTADTATFADGRWYVVTNDVRWGTIKVDGSAHLILCDGAKLTANAITNGALTVYGQPSGCGELKVSGTVSTALTCEGGILFAGTLSGGSLAVVGGTLAADDVRNDSVMIAGGSVKAETIENAPSNGVERVYCVTAKWSEEGRAGSEEGRAGSEEGRAGSAEGRAGSEEGRAGSAEGRAGSEEGRAGSEEGRAGSEEVRVGRLAIEGLGGYGTNDIYPVEGAVYLWLPNGAYRFAVSDGETTYRYFAIVDGSGITVEPLPPSVPVTPGGSSGPYTTAEDATNAMWAAFIRPRDDVAAVLGTDVLLKDYRKMFGFAVTGGGEAWFVEAVLTLTARTNLAATATAATRQIPVAAIARLPDASAIAQQPEIATLAVATSVTVDGCAPGFFYSLYDGRALTNIVADANATNLNVLCGADAKVTFPEVKKPSDAAGFFRVGVRDAPGVTPSDVSHAPITILK